jgi:hypothetical protein
VNANDGRSGLLFSAVGHEQPRSHPIICFGLKADVIARNALLLGCLLDDWLQRRDLPWKLSEKVEPRPFDLLPSLRPCRAGLFLRGRRRRGGLLGDVGKREAGECRNT